MIPGWTTDRHSRGVPGWECVGGSVGVAARGGAGSLGGVPSRSCVGGSVGGGAGWPGVAARGGAGSLGGVAGSLGVVGSDPTYIGP